MEFMQWSPETIVLDLENSIPTPPNIELMEKAEADAALARRPKWDAKPFDIDADLAKGNVGEVVPADLSRMRTTDPLTAHITRVVESELRKLAHRNDDREPLEVNPDDEPIEQEPTEPPADVRADIAFLKTKADEGVDLYDYTNRMLTTDLPRAKELKKALAWLSSERPELLKVTA